MKENMENEVKFIREDDPELEDMSDYTNYLADAYVQTGDISYRDALLEAFNDYLKKYVKILHKGSGGVDFNNKDTKNFLRLLMSKDERTSEFVFLSCAGTCLHSIRMVMSKYTSEDLYHEMIVIFLSLVNKYRPIQYARGNKTYRISFAHFLQVNCRYEVAKLVRDNRKDVITGQNCFEYMDDFCKDIEDKTTSIELPISLTGWVWGKESEPPFSDLSDADRHLLWLRYESDPSGKVLSTRELGEKTGFHERTIIYRLKKIKSKIKELLGGMNELSRV